jgi:hypothetical protein
MSTEAYNQTTVDAVRRENLWLRTAIEKQEGGETLKQYVAAMSPYFEGLTKGRTESAETITRLRQLVEELENK